MKRLLRTGLLAVLGSCLALTARAELCGKCKDLMFTMDSKACPVCRKGWTASGSNKMCPACSAIRRQCEHCGAALEAPSKVLPEEAQGRLQQYREQLEKEHPGSTKSPGAVAEQQAAAAVAKWLEAMGNRDAAAAMAISGTPFSWDRKVVDAEGLKKLLKNWVVEIADKKAPLKFSAPTFLGQAPVKDVGEQLIWVVAFDQSGRTDDAITFYVKPGPESKVVGFRD